VDQSFPDILTLLRTKSNDHPNYTALEDIHGNSINYIELLNKVECLASALQNITSLNEIKPRLGIVLPNGIDMSLVLLASSVIGTALPFNPKYTLAEFEAYFKETEISGLITDSGTSAAAEAAANRLGLKIIFIDRLEATSDIIVHSPPGSQTAIVLLTSGTTGRAKRVPLTHSNICTSSRDIVRSISLNPSDKCLSMWELFHVGGLVDLLLAPLHAGSTVIATKGFDPNKFFELLEELRPTWFQAVPTTLNELLLVAKRKGIKTSGSSLRFIRSVAAPLSNQLQNEIEKLFGVPVVTTFGMTEASPLITSTSLSINARKLGSVGRSCGTEIGILDLNHNTLIFDTEGEVIIRGPNVFAGYENNEEGNKNAFWNGWFKTGDLGKVDSDGYLFLTGRIKEIINRGGEKVNVREVDEAIESHPAIAQGASYPIPHRTLGEDVAVAVVPKPYANITTDELREYLYQKLAPFKIPSFITFEEELPRNTVGKIDRRALSSQYGKKRQKSDITLDLTETQLVITNIWKRELDVESIDLDENFISLGGDSLASLRMFVAVEAAFNILLPTQVLTEISTVRQLSKAIIERGTPRISEEENKQQRSIIDEIKIRQIVTLMDMGHIPPMHYGSILKVGRREGAKPPLIWFFNSPEKEMSELSKYILDDIPLYGGFSGGKLIDRSDDTLLELANLYTREIVRFFPNQSFIIGGNCQGGRVAFMVAKLLIQAGREISNMCFLEFSHQELCNYNIPMLLMFGKHSKMRSYQNISWGKPGWDERFTIKPTVTWVNGLHGDFFNKRNTQSLIKPLNEFLNNSKISSGTLNSMFGQAIMLVHKLPVAFYLYRSSHKIINRIIFGKNVKYNPFTGDPN